MIGVIGLNKDIANRNLYCGRYVGCRDCRREEGDGMRIVLRSASGFFRVRDCFKYSYAILYGRTRVA